MELKEKFIKEKCVRNIAGEPIVACASADWIWKFFEPYISIPLDEPVKPACKNLKQILKDYENLLIDIMGSRKVSIGSIENYYKTTFSVEGINNFYGRLQNYYIESQREA